MEKLRKKNVTGSLIIATHNFGFILLIPILYPRLSRKMVWFGLIFPTATADVGIILSFLLYLFQSKVLKVMCTTATIRNTTT